MKRERSLEKASEVAEEEFSKVKFWREVFAALTGMHGVYVLSHFAFDNCAGGVCSLFLFLCFGFAQVDRRFGSYILTALFSFSFAIVLSTSLATPLRGFEALSSNLLLRRVCVTQLLLLLLAAPVSVAVALKIRNFHNFLREPGVLLPLPSSETCKTHKVHSSQQVLDLHNLQKAQGPPKGRNFSYEIPLGRPPSAAV
ncbi:hypothetical protein, conserved [Eimeria tenella]|uniref:Transmembrane protein n=1 Tax=Eimeria tenella TaxID=5802 RepID=U6KRL7_EIMTE|nr:hypothetical protein, conserved [Eimeria tenella]CDJ39558.1 hypothetical protein, conserved [Eimeria tenella]|eukprot:XP_013230313.1 hypothetical protein, conserved [Eimeria tenella]